MNVQTTIVRVDCVTTTQILAALKCDRRPVYEDCRRLAALRRQHGITCIDVAVTADEAFSEKTLRVWEAGKPWKASHPQRRLWISPSSYRKWIIALYECIQERRAALRSMLWRRGMLTD